VVATRGPYAAPGGPARSGVRDRYCAPIDLREALYTTRAMRHVTSEPIPVEVQERILDAAIRAPSGGNAQSWRFLLIDDVGVRATLAPLYRSALDELWGGLYAPRLAAAAADPDSVDSKQLLRMRRSADHLADHFADVPLLMFGFVQGDASGGSIFPAIWSAMLAARGEGVGSALTSVLAFRAAETLEVLSVPSDEGWHMACCVTFGYPTGRWGVPDRRPVHDVAYRNRWGEPVGFEIASPLWP
jgi:nitroreductase